MTQGDEPGLEARMAALETDVRELKGRVARTEQDAAAARVLAGGADRDVNEVRTEIRDFRQATTASFNAMREDLGDLRRDLDGLREHVDSGFAEVRGRLDGVAAGHEQIVGMLTTLLDRETGPDAPR
ncbi:permease [Pseudonocardia lacus]|uniref:permease n=1 Tax=Pseudonocardia lacus TaxID=2835865 RepID=UPI0020297023|nr:permease [Pseudonocardia lacus]